MNKVVYILQVVILSLLINSCSITKQLKDGEYLLTKVEVESEDNRVSSKEIVPFLRQKPNSRFLGVFKFYSWLYGLSDKESSLWRKVGEAPSIYDQNETDRTLIEIESYLRNLGYYRSVVKDSVYFDGNRAKLTYKIKGGLPIRIRESNLIVNEHVVKDILAGFKSDVDRFKGTRLEIDEFGLIRDRIYDEVLDSGYYNFSKESIYFKVDTVAYDADVDLVVDAKDGEFLSKYKYKEIKIIFDNSEIEKIDESLEDNFRFYSDDRLNVSRKVIVDAVRLDDNPTYKSSLVQKTYNQLSKLKMFKSVRINIDDTGKFDSDGYRLLDCQIYLASHKPKRISFELEGTNTSGSLGVGAGVSYQHNSLFRRGEVLNLNLNGSIESQKYGADGDEKNFMTNVLGGDLSVTIPKFIFPFVESKRFKYEVPFTQFQGSYNYQQRPDYTRSMVGVGVSYRWKASELVTHSVTPLRLDLVRMYDLDSLFLESIENLSIKSSYINHSIFAFNYTYTYDSSVLNKRSYTHFRGMFESSGNLLYGINSLFDTSKKYDEDSDSYKYHFFDTPYAQYLKSSLELRKGVVIDKYNSLAFRGYIGVVVPYGNSDQVPFEKKFYGGGANGVRGWGVRTLGPGIFVAGDDEYPNQTGDIKLEFNAEYRFPIVSYLKGALFGDVGNIWSLNDNREGAEFEFGRFYKDFAVSPGLGLRLDIDYAVFRLDCGLKLFDPSETVGKRLLFRDRRFDNDDLHFTFAIGYPF